MPTQLPLESTDLFGDLLIPHTFDILQSDATKPLESHNFSISIQSVCIQKANKLLEYSVDIFYEFLQSIVASNGNLTDNFQYISELREASM